MGSVTRGESYTPRVLKPLTSAGRLSMFTAFVLVVAAGRARAEDPACPAPLQRGPQEVTPAAGATGVTLDSAVRVRYSEGYFATGAPVDLASMLTIERDSSPVPGTVTRVGDSTLFFFPDEPWDNATRYTGIARGRGSDPFLTLSFLTGFADDLGPPELGGIHDITSSEVQATCDAPEGGFRIDVTFAPAPDDGPLADVEYFLYLTRGELVDAPVLVARQRNFATSEITMAFVLSRERAASPACVVVMAQDGAGNIDDDGTATCFDPIDGSFFEPLCSAAPGRGPRRGAAGSAATVVLVASLGLLAWRRRAAARACR